MRTLDEQFPPTIPAADQSVATFIPGRNPEFKVHKSAGLAHSALGQRGFGDRKAKYEFHNGEWKRVWAYVPPANCRRCSRRYDDVVASEQARRTHRGWITKYQHDPSYDGPVWCSEPVCIICVREIRAETEKAEEEAAARALHERYFINK